MSRGHVVQILFVEEDAAVWPRAEAFFRHQLGLVGAEPELHTLPRLPKRAAGFDLVSLDGRGLLSALRVPGDLLTDLRDTAIVNLHAEVPGPATAISGCSWTAGGRVPTASGCSPSPGWRPGFRSPWTSRSWVSCPAG